MYMNTYKSKANLYRQKRKRTMSANSRRSKRISRPPSVNLHLSTNSAQKPKVRPSQVKFTHSNFQIIISEKAPSNQTAEELYSAAKSAMSPD